MFLLVHTTVSAQIKVGNNPTIINSSAIMELEADNKGFLLPRMQLTSVSSPAPLPQHVDYCYQRINRWGYSIRFCNY